MFGKSAKFLLSHPFEFSSFKSVFVFKGFRASNRFLFSLNLCPRGRGAGAPRRRGAESDSPSCLNHRIAFQHMFLNAFLMYHLQHYLFSIFSISKCVTTSFLLIFSLSNNQKVWTRIFIEIGFVFI